MSNLQEEPNELHPELLHICGFNPYAQHDSSGREQMLSQHLGQMLVLKGSTERNIQTGIERETSKYTFNVKMPVDGQIIEIVERYKHTLGQDAILENPQTVVIYEDVVTKEIGMINLAGHCSNHQYFGFEYISKSGMQKIKIGEFIAKDTVFLDSPSVTDEGGYKYGIELNMALMTHPAVSEDGILICEDVLPKLRFKTYEHRTVEWGSKKFALNLYGDAKNYKPFPDIGEVLRPDGLLMALRSYDPSLLACVEQSVKDTMRVDFTFDNTYYANGPGGKVVDIKVHHDINNSNHADVHMDKQVQKYDTARRQFYGKLVEIWKKYHKKRGDALQITPELQRLIVEALSVHTEGTSQRVGKLYRQAPLDDYRVEFVIEYETTPGIGYKLTDLHGGKGVVCAILPRNHMPVDSQGNSADIVMDPNSTVSRMNLGRIYELYTNSASRDVHKTICSNLGLKCFTSENASYNHLSRLPEEVINGNFDYLINYYGIVSPLMKQWILDGKLNQSKIEYLSEIVNKGITLYVPTDNAPETPNVVRQIENSDYKPTYGPVNYVGNSGRLVTTKENVRIGSMYFVLLEKIGDDWAAVASAKLQHFGVPAQLTKSDKYSKPARNQAVRGAGEAEIRIFASYVGSEFVAEMMDRNNSPKTHKTMVKNILQAKTPTDIDNLVDRKVNPFGGSKPIGLITHIASCGGWEFKYKPYITNWDAPKVNINLISK